MGLFKFILRAAIGVAAVAILAVTLASPAQALLPGCTCPAGSTPVGNNQCFFAGLGTFPATCIAPTPPAAPSFTTAFNQSVGHLAASQQQLSFWGIRQILEDRRDQLQGTLGSGRRPTGMISGYAPSDLDAGSDLLSYAGQSKHTNPLATPLYKAPPAAMSSGTSWAVWSQGLADQEHDNPTSVDDLGHFTHIYAGQGGFDTTWQNVAGGALVVGLVGSWTGAHVSYDGSATTTKMEGPGGGLYATYVNGGFSVDVTNKYDFLHLTEDFAGLVPANALNLTNAGVSGNIQYKAESKGGGAFIEPTAGFSFTRTLFGSGAAAIGLDDTSTLRLQAGARLGGSWDANGISFEPSLKALVYSNVIAQGSAAADAAAGIVPTDAGKVRGEVDPELNWDFGSGYSATLNSSVRFGEGMLGGSASLNLRKQW